jgi:capsid protein
VATDIADYGDPDAVAGVDFLAQAVAPAGVTTVVTNPPFMHADEFVRRALTLVPRVVMLLPLTFLAGQGRSDIVWGGQLARVYVFQNRLQGMHRGPLASILTRALEIDATEDAGIMLQKVAALLSIFVPDPSGTFDLAALTKPGGLFDDGVKPGGVHILPGEVVPTVVNPPKSDSLVDFSRHLIRSVASGLGLPAWKVSGDLSDVNFSSARLGLLNWQRRAQSLQRNLLVGQFLDPVFRRFVALETIAGRLNVDLDRLPPPTWLFAAWPAVDVLKECEADVLAISAGIKSRTEVISAGGRDPEAVRAEIARDPTPLPAAPAQNPRSTQNV